MYAGGLCCSIAHNLFLVSRTRILELELERWIKFESEKYMEGWMGVMEIGREDLGVRINILFRLNCSFGLSCIIIV